MLEMIESTLGLQSLAARDASAMDLRPVLRHELRHPVPPGGHPGQQPGAGPASDAAAVCGAASVQSVCPRRRPGAEGPPRRGSCHSRGIQPEAGWRD
jgi:hypothetical protein